AGIDQRDVGGVFLRQRREVVDRHIVFAPGGAQREQPLLDLLKLGGIVIGCALRRSSRRIAAENAGTDELAPVSVSCASRRSPATFSACIMVARRSASVVSSPACGASLVSSSTEWRR